MTNEMMDFPETWEEYEQQFGFEDTDEVYTNGSRLIPSFRVKQWLDHLSVSERKLGEWIKEEYYTCGVPDGDEWMCKDKKTIHTGNKCDCPFVETHYRWVCSICGERAADQMFPSHFCPNCGADMRTEPYKTEKGE